MKSPAVAVFIGDDGTWFVGGKVLIVLREHLEPRVENGAFTSREDDIVPARVIFEHSGEVSAAELLAAATLPEVRAQLEGVS